MDAVEIALRWEDWVVFHGQVPAGTGFTDPPWWPSDVPPLSTRLRWRGKDIPLFDGTPLPEAGLAFWAGPLRVQLRPTWITRATDTRPEAPLFLLGTGALTGWICLLATFLPPPVTHTLIDLPDRCQFGILFSPTLGSNGAAMPGSLGALGNNTGEDKTSAGQPLASVGTEWLGAAHGALPMGLFSQRGGVDLHGQRQGAGLGPAGTGAGAHGRSWLGHSAAGEVLMAGIGLPDTPSGLEAPSASEITPLYYLPDDIDPREDGSSRFSLSMDTTAYAQVQHALQTGGALHAQRPTPEAFLNAQVYALRQPATAAGELAAITLESAPHPWHAGRRLLRVGLVVDGFAASGNTVQAQVIFSPEAVQSYRLIGEEVPDPSAAPLRHTPSRWRQAGDLVVTALYEYVPVPAPGQGILAEVQVLIEPPDGGEALALTERLRVSAHHAWLSPDMRTAVSAATLAEKLRGDAHTAGISYAQIAAMGSAEVAAMAQHAEALPDPR